MTKYSYLMYIVSLNHNREYFTFTSDASHWCGTLILTYKQAETNGAAVPNLQRINLFLRYRYVIQTSQGWYSGHRSKSAGYPGTDMQSSAVSWISLWRRNELNRRPRTFCFCGRCSRVRFLITWNGRNIDHILEYQPLCILALLILFLLAHEIMLVEFLQL